MKKLTEIRDGLQESIRELDSIKYMFVERPKRDFIRDDGPLRFQNMIEILLGAGAGTVEQVLLEYFDWAADTPSVPAFVEQRHKIKPEALEFLFRDQVAQFEPIETFRGYHLLACDSTGLPIAPDENDELTYFRELDKSRPYAFVRLSLLYDLLAERYVDVLLQPAHGDAEIRCMNVMLDRYRGPKNTITIVDRGFEAWNNIAHLNALGMFLMRARSPRNRAGILQALPVPKDGLYDVDISVTLSRSVSKEARALPGYKRLASKTEFDYIDTEHPFYEIKLRVVRIPLRDGTIETLITNLPRELFSDDDLRELYWRRWGEESSFSTLKYDEGLLQLHSKTPKFILQEIFAHLIMYNVDSLMRHQLPPLNESGQHEKRYDTAAAVLVCRAFLRHEIEESAAISIMRRSVLPVRENYGEHERIRRFHGAAPFRYRPAI